MKVALGLTFLLAAAALLAGPISSPRLTKLDHTYEFRLDRIILSITTNEELDLASLSIQSGKLRGVVPLEELADIAQPHLKDVNLTVEADLTVVEIPYGLAVDGVDGWFEAVLFTFRDGLYVGRERKVPTKQEASGDEIVTHFQYFEKNPRENEERGGTGKTNTLP